MHTHRVVAAKRLAAIRALPRAVGQSILYALVAEHVPASLDDRVLEFALANLTLNQQLHSRHFRALVSGALLLVNLHLLLQSSDLSSQLVPLGFRFALSVFCRKACRILGFDNLL